MVAPKAPQSLSPQVKLRILTEDYCEFVLSNVNASIANALRRVILAEVSNTCSQDSELMPYCPVQCPMGSMKSAVLVPRSVPQVPTIAIELVEIESNTTVLNDEYIAHRLGLVPFVSSRVHDMKTIYEATEDDDWTDVEFTLNVRCVRMGGIENLLETAPSLLAGGATKLGCAYRSCMPPACWTSPILGRFNGADALGTRR